MIVDHDEGDEDLDGPRFIGITATGVLTWCASCCAMAFETRGECQRCPDHGSEPLHLLGIWKPQERADRVNPRSDIFRPRFPIDGERA